MEPSDKIFLILMSFVVVGCSPAIRSSAPASATNYSTSNLTQDFTWSFVDGDGMEGVNYNTTRGAKSPSATVLNGSLYTAWREQTTGSTHDNIRVAKYDGGSAWSLIDGDGATGININTTDFAAYPSIIGFSNNLYVAWHEAQSNWHIHVAVWDGVQAFTPVESNSTNGLNYLSTENAYHPLLQVFNGSLYCAWSENNQVRISQYGGGTTWSFIDGGGATGINYDTTQSASNYQLTVYANQLYSSWDEVVSGVGNVVVHVARYDGSSWAFVDGGTATGINYNPTASAGGLQQIEQNGKLVVVWIENNIVRAKTYDGTTWTSIDNGGLNVDMTQTAQISSMQNITSLNGNLYVAWSEKSATYPTVYQYRVAQYDGTSWTIVSGNNAAAGLNYNPANTLFSDSTTITAFDGGLMSMWGEQDNSGVYQVRAIFGIQ